MASMLKLVDKFFPAGPEPEPTRLALARQATVMMFPKGTIAQAMTGLVDRTVDRALDMSEADFAAIVPPAKDKNGKAKKPAALRTEERRVRHASRYPYLADN